MPTIKLTDEQAEELKSLLQIEIDESADSMRRCGEGDPDYASYRHYNSVLSDILHLLEIA